jgi:hypothetical protein
MRLCHVALLLAIPGAALAESESTAPEDVSGTGASVVPATTAADRYAGTLLPPPAGWRLMVSDLSLIRLNPIGLETRARIGMQRRLYESDAKLYQNNFAFVGAFPRLSPANVQMSFGGEIQPLSIFNLRAFVDYQQYFGTFGFVQSFTTPDSNYSDQTLRDLRDVPGREPQAASALHVGIAPLLQFKAGPVALRTLWQFEYWDFGLREGDTVAYEPTVDTLLPDRGWTLTTDTDVLYTGRPGLAIGLRHTFIKPFYKARHFADRSLSEVENQEEFEAFGGRNAHQRLGLFAAYTLRDRGPSRFNKPTIILIASYYLDHRWRTGTPAVLRPGERPDDFTTRAFPYLLAAFAFESDLLAVR